ncbi:hypothetical protein BDR04DRAFT_633248 [Suillus decipiens]|nr:hypothetical protein BDR04DRAFT_633248 [Suillus decipiens]
MASKIKDALDTNDFAAFGAPFDVKHVQPTLTANIIAPPHTLTYRGICHLQDNYSSRKVRVSGTAIEHDLATTWQQNQCSRATGSTHDHALEHKDHDNQVERHSACETSVTNKPRHILPSDHALIYSLSMVSSLTCQRTRGWITQRNLMKLF